MIFKTVLLALLTASAVNVFAISYAKEYEKVIEKTFDISDGGQVEIHNKYGNVDIRHSPGSEVSFRIEIEVDAKDQERADEVFDLINIDFYSNTDYIKAETEISEGNKNFWKKFMGSNNENYEINYFVTVPTDIYLNLHNKYGNIYAVDMDNNMDINLKYGNFEIGSVHDLDVDLKYGNGEVDNCRDLDVEVGYGKFQVTQTADVDVISKYSRITIEEAQAIDSKSKYDHYNIGKAVSFDNEGKYDDLDVEYVDNVEINTRYTNIKLDRLEKTAEIDANYGSITIKEFSSEMEEIDIESTYAGVKIGREDNVGFRFDIYTKYGSINIDHGTGEFGDEDNEEWAKGHHKGKGNGMIKVDSKYGNVRIR